jgi:hypothetical protein
VALSTPAKTTAGILAAVLLGAAAFVGYRLLTKDPNEPLLEIPFVSDPVTCPLTGEETEREKVAARRALAVKIENIAEARPQAGLAEADVVYEQEAEGGITRFIVVYQCGDARRLGPVRSARPVDPSVIQQLGDPLFVHAGSVQAVVNAIDRAGLEDINCNLNPQPCPRDPAHTAPHDVFTSTRTLFQAGAGGEAPQPLFTYDAELDRRGTRQGRELHLDFSPATDVVWRYQRSGDRYLRFHAETPHTLEDGDQVGATNVVVQLVDRTSTRITDAAGNPVPNYDVIGKGRAIVFRDGRAIVGTWSRPSPEEVTTFLTRQGEEIPLAPGNTWVELFPTDAPAEPEFS